MLLVTPLYSLDAILNRDYRRPIIRLIAFKRIKQEKDIV